MEPFVSLIEFLEELFEKVYFETKISRRQIRPVGKGFILHFGVKVKTHKAGQGCNIRLHAIFYAIILSYNVEHQW